jgi:hypothetical protein
VRPGNHLSILLALIMALIGNAAFASMELLFIDEFDSATLENWEQVLGEWAIEDGKVCVIECPS